MNLLAGMPGDALKAGASIVGTGTTMEGINQNPVYYEYGLWGMTCHQNPSIYPCFWGYV